MSAPWPQIPDQFVDAKAEAKIERVFEITRALRALRAELGLTPGQQIPLAFYEGDLGGDEWIVRSQAWVQELKPGKPSETHISTTVEGVDLHLPTAGLVDAAKECERIEREAVKVREELEKVQIRLSDATFIERAKPEVVERTREQGTDLQIKLEKLDQRRKLFGC